MNEENKQILLNHIRDGRYMAYMDFDVRLMMAQEGMELYAKPCCERIEREGLAQYVYLAVQAYGKENRAEVNHTKPVKSYLEIEQRYRDLKQVMEAVGRLTPSVLMKIYPVTKEYDGNRWDCKDYFYTMDKLRNLPADKPIGDAQDVACLLWDYQNRALKVLLLQWMNVLGDLEIYCDEPGPNDEFHKRLTQRSKSKKEEREEKKG